MLRKLVYLFLLVLLTTLLITCMTAAAQGGDPTDPLAGIELPPGVEEVITLAGLGQLLPLIIEFAKRLGWVKDGYAGKATVLACVIVYAVLIVGGTFGFTTQTEQGQLVIAVATKIVTLGLMIYGALAQFRSLRSAQVINKLPGRP